MMRDGEIEWISPKKLYGKKNKNKKRIVHQGHHISPVNCSNVPVVKIAPFGVFKQSSGFKEIRQHIKPLKKEEKKRIDNNDDDND